MDEHIPRKRDEHIERCSVSAVTVAVLTYRRPDHLKRVLPALIDQAAALTPAASVLVVDNDPDGAARELVCAFSYPHLRYAHEPRPGIAAARNRALDEAADAHALVFIDDDEMPGPGWLEAHVNAWREWRCAGVAGPVESQFDRSAHPWVAASGVFDRRVHATGDRVSGAATHNLLLDVGWLRRLDMRFDERLGLTGGEDTMFSHQLIDRGATIRWCDEALVLEPVPADRLTQRWVLRRAYRAGSSWSHMELALSGSGAARVRTRASLLARGVVNLCRGIALSCAGSLTNDVRRRARGAVQTASYAGLLAGCAGLTFREYRRH